VALSGPALGRRPAHRAVRRPGPPTTTAAAVQAQAGVTARDLARLRHPSAAAAPRTALRVLAPPTLSLRARRRRVGLLVTAVISVVALGLFGVVSVHVVLTQDQLRLERLQGQVAAERASVDAERLKLSQMESPERIVQEAERQDHMVVPSSTRYLFASPPPGTATRPSAGR
jgi:cell division protein FtsL